MSGLLFGTTFLCLHLGWVIVDIVFLDARGKSTHSADVMIFGLMLGVVFAVPAMLGYFGAGLVLRRIQNLREWKTPVIGALLAFTFLASGLLLRSERYFRQNRFAKVSESPVSVVSLVLLGFASAFVVVGSSKLAKRISVRHLEGT